MQGRYSGQTALYWPPLNAPYKLMSDIESTVLPQYLLSPSVGQRIAPPRVIDSTYTHATAGVDCRVIFDIFPAPYKPRHRSRRPNLN